VPGRLGNFAASSPKVDAEREDDAGVQSTNIIPDNKTSCKVLPLSAYLFADVRSGEGQIQVQP